MESVACVIPARFNSSRFPGKLLAKVRGKTILQRTFEQVLQYPNWDAVFVATDDERIAQHVLDIGGEVIWTSTHCQNGTERILEALQKEVRLQKASFIVNVQGDHPCTSPNTIRAILQAIASDPLAAMSSAVSLIRSREDYLSSHVVKCVFDTQGNALYFSRSPIPYVAAAAPLKAYAHIGIYCYRTLFLKEKIHSPATFLQQSEDLEQLKVLEHGHRVKIAIVEEEALGIDIPEDLEKLEKFLCV